MASLETAKKSSATSTKQKQWFVIYCKPNTAKKTASQLNKAGIKVYCPTRIEVRQWSDRKKKVEVPVLPSMVFVFLTEKERNSVFQVSTVVRYLFWLKKPAVVKEEEIELLQEVLSNKSSLVEVENVQKGDYIKLKGLGFEEDKAVLKYESKTHLCVYLERLGFIIKIKK
jgi:transcription antitermination factor NusG